MPTLRHRRWILLALIGSAASAGAQRPMPGAGADALADTARLARRVDALFAERIRPDQPGCAIGVYRDGRVVLARGYGLASLEDRRPITARTTFDLGSAAKPFTALAALLLEQRGRLPLADDVRRWVPELPDYATAYGAPLRVRDLLQHTSGLRDWGALATLSGDHPETMHDLVALLAAQRALNFAPGARHEYSHSDFALLGLVVERAAGEPFGRFVERELLRPLGMDGSVVNDGRIVVPERAAGHVDSAGRPRLRHPTSTMVGDGNLYTSVEDLAGLDRQLATGRVGGPEIRTRMLGRPTLANGDTIPYAYGLRVDTHHGLRAIMRSGSSNGLRSVFVRYPDQRFAVAALCNSDALEPWRFADEVARLFLGDALRPASREPRGVLPPTIAVDPSTLARYAGTWRSAVTDVPAVFEVRDGTLGEVMFHEVLDDTLFRLLPVGTHHFVGLGATGNVGHYYYGGGTDAISRIVVVYRGDTLDRLERLPDTLVRPPAAALAEYAGRWFSPDLDTAWELAVRGDRLLLRRRDGRALTFRQLGADEFVRGFGWWAEPLLARFSFHRDASGTVTHFTVSTPPGEDSVRDLRFDRITPP